jgi:hypothetical protein
MKEIFKPAPEAEPADPGPVFYTITAEDVDKTVILTTLTLINVTGQLGRVRYCDVGKRIYRTAVSDFTQPCGSPAKTGWVWRVESSEQRDERLGLGIWQARAAKGLRGIQIGDGNTQSNTFG